MNYNVRHQNTWIENPYVSIVKSALPRSCCSISDHVQLIWLSQTRSTFLVRDQNVHKSQRELHGASFLFGFPRAFALLFPPIVEQHADPGR